MSELAYRRVQKADTIEDIKPEDALASAIHEIVEMKDECEHVIIIRAKVTDEGLAYCVTQGGTFDIARRMGLISLVSHRLIGQ